MPDDQIANGNGLKAVTPRVTPRPPRKDAVMQPLKASPPTSIAYDVPTSEDREAPIGRTKPSIIERLLLDRVQRSDRWAIRLTAGIVILALMFVWISYQQLAQVKSLSDQNAATIAVLTNQAQSLTSQTQSLASQAAAITGQLDEMKKQTAIIQRFSTADRAHLTIDIESIVRDLPIFTPANRVIVNLSFNIVNQGRTEATIEDIETHLYARASEPDPFSALGKSTHETIPDGTIVFNGPTYAEFQRQSPTNVIIPAGPNAIKTANQSFVFVGTDQWSDRWDWASKDARPEEVRLALFFYYKIKYRDIYGIERTVAKYIALNNAKASDAENKQYNQDS